jgi:hypothetical protein
VVRSSNREQKIKIVVVDKLEMVAAAIIVIAT